VPPDPEIDVPALDLAGATPALPTPRTGAATVDLEVAADLVARAFDAGAPAVLVGGSTGEGPLVPAVERAAMTRRAVEVAAGRPVLGCACGATAADVHADVQRLADAGASMVLVLAPTYFPLTPDETVDLQWAVADVSPVPVLAYHIPQLTHAPLTPDAVARLATHPNVHGMKDSSGDTARLVRFVEAASDQDFVVLQGAAPQLLDSLDAGAAGSITAIANVLPATLPALHRAVASGDRDEAATLQTEVSRVMAALAAVPGPTSTAVKLAMQLQGEVTDATPWPPLRPVEDDAAVVALRDALRDAEVAAAEAG
jgi:4-hydroxy-tetrahydrodipicolinate synthase